MEVAIKTQRFYDQRISRETTFVLPGEHFISADENTPISTLLGSCVAACIRDTISLAGGLNHFLLPESLESSIETHSSRYGVYAMEILINDLLKQGAKKENLEAKIFGGANIISTSFSETIGDQNGNFVKNYLNSEGIPILAQDLGGLNARRIYFYPETGRVSVLRIEPSNILELSKEELELRQRVRKQTLSGEIELF